MPVSDQENSAETEVREERSTPVKIRTSPVEPTKERGESNETGEGQNPIAPTCSLATTANTSQTTTGEQKSESLMFLRDEETDKRSFPQLQETAQLTAKGPIQADSECPGQLDDKNLENTLG